MRKLLLIAVLLGLMLCALIPSASFTEDQDTILLARTLYALGKDESYETKLALGSVVMNRLENGWFANDLGEVLGDQQQFPAGKRYDDDSLRAAHALLTGKRAIGSSALYYQSADASRSWGEVNKVGSAGSYNFYSKSGND